MNILIDLIFSPSHGKKTDHRWELWTAIGSRLNAKGHSIYCNNVGKGIIPSFKKYNDEIGPEIDFYISHSPYDVPKRIRRFEYFKNREIPVLVYDHGWLPESLVTDRKKLFGDSYYYETIGEMIDAVDITPSIEEYRKKLLDGNISKRPQDRLQELPCSDYIFIAGQVLYDCSVVHYSKTGLVELIEKTTEFAESKNIPVVYKPHPGISEKFPLHGKQELAELASRMKREHPNFHVVKTSIYDLMKKARFTVCINSGSIVDNLVTQTPVYCCGDSFFAKSGTVIYEPDVIKGLSLMYETAYDVDLMKLRQTKMLSWLKDHMIQKGLTVEENIRRLEFFSGLKF